MPLLIMLALIAIANLVIAIAKHNEIERISMFYGLFVYDFRKGGSKPRSK